MTKSELIERLALRSSNLSVEKAEEAVNCLLKQISQALSEGKRAEVRGFGNFTLHYRGTRMGRNPKTGGRVKLNAKYVPHFKAGKTLKEKVDASV